jgi:hypothetical protein
MIVKAAIPNKRTAALRDVNPRADHKETVRR